MRAEVKSPEPKALTEHLDWPRPDAARLGEAVKTMLESEGWTALCRSIDERLSFEQKCLMASPTREGDETYERLIGQWAGMRRVAALAEGIVATGEKAEREMREAA